MSWPTKKLTDICDLERGTEPGSAFYIEASDKSIPFLRVGDLTGKVDAPKFVKSDNGNLRTVNGNETLITFDGTPGIVVRGFKGAIASGIRVVRNIKPEVDESFLFYYLQTQNVQKTIKAYSKGATIIHASTSIPYIKIPLPHLATQKQIVERLDKIAEAQKLNDDLIQKSDELFQSLLHQELNPAGPADAKAMAGKKDWGVKKLGDIVEVKGGKRIPKGMNFSSEKTNHPYLRVTDFINNSIKIDGLKYIDEQVFQCIKRYIISSKDIYISIAGTIGLVGKIQRELEGANLTENAAKLLINEKIVDQGFLIFYLSTNNAKNQIKTFTQAVGVPKLALERIEKIKVALPPLETQKQIAAKLSAAQEYKTQLLAQRAKLKELFDSVLYKSMNPQRPQ